MIKHASNRPAQVISDLLARIAVDSKGTHNDRNINMSTDPYIWEVNALQYLEKHRDEQMNTLAIALLDEWQRAGRPRATLVKPKNSNPTDPPWR